MRLSLLFMTVAGLLLTSSVPNAVAQSHQIHPLNSCISEFYDPGMYNYLTFKNNCGQSVTIVFVAKDESGATGTMDLRPGASDSVGRLANGVVPKVGAFQLYVCEAGSVPVDEQNKVVDKPHTVFHCQSKTQ